MSISASMFGPVTPSKSGPARRASVILYRYTLTPEKFRFKLDVQRTLNRRTILLA